MTGTCVSVIYARKLDNSSNVEGSRKRRRKEEETQLSKTQIFISSERGPKVLFRGGIGMAHTGYTGVDIGRKVVFWFTNSV